MTLTPDKPKIVVICGSSRFVDIMAVCAWLIERKERAIGMALHLLPQWYPNVPADHLAEHEGVNDEMDELHLRKIDLADEIFVVNQNYYIGDSTKNEIDYAKINGKPRNSRMCCRRCAGPLRRVGTADGRNCSGQRGNANL